MPRDCVSVVIPAFDPGPRLADVVARASRLSRVAEVIVVDDASPDDVAARFAGQAPASVRFVRSSQNLGRGPAINLGVGQCRSAFVLFLDADCIPTSEDLAERHLRVLKDGASASVGAVTGAGTDFWNRYAARANAARITRSQGFSAALTTANMMISRVDFASVGGFDPSFSRYGFEDRDLLIRLSNAGLRVVVCATAEVEHHDRISLRSVARKMRDSGRHTGPVFRARHPSQYKQLRYAHFDAQLHPLRAACLVPLARFAVASASLAEGLLHVRAVPFSVRCALVQVWSALAYLLGSWEARHQPRAPSASS